MNPQTFSECLHDAYLAGPIHNVRVAAVHFDGRLRAVVQCDMGMGARTGDRQEGVTVTGCTSTTYIYVLDTGQDVRALEREILDAAYRYGALDAARLDQYALPPHADPWETKWGLTNAFGGTPYQITAFGVPAELTHGEKALYLVPHAAQRGYTSWHFRPAYRRHENTPPAIVEEWRREDPTLRPDGSRENAPLEWQLPPYETGTLIPGTSGVLQGGALTLYRIARETAKRTGDAAPRSHRSPSRSGRNGKCRAKYPGICTRTRQAYAVGAWVRKNTQGWYLCQPGKQDAQDAQEMQSEA